MATDAPASQAALRSLPPVGEYLRRLIELGKQSIPVAIPALLFLWFYHFGTDLYLEIAGRATSPLGYPDTQARLYHALMKISAYLPLLVLVYTPFLPLQDSLLRGQPPSFLASIRQVLDRLVSFILSAILQTLIIFVPIAIVIGIVVLAVAPFPALPPEAGVLIALTVALPCLLWIFLSATFLVFAIPAVVLDGHGPMRSIALSFRMVASHFWSVNGRFFVFFLLLLVFVLIACIPAMLLNAGGALLAQAGIAFRIGAIFWTSLVTALTFPFWVAALMLQYRALAPSGDEAVAIDAIPLPGTEPPKTGQGGQPTPYIFE
jgi:hypothetical protein